MLSDLVMPANAELLAALQDELSPPERIAADVIADLQDEVVDAPPPMPVGAGEVQGDHPADRRGGPLRADDAAGGRCAVPGEGRGRCNDDVAPHVAPRPC